MPEETPFSALQAVLTENDYSTTLLPIDDENPYEKLFVSIGDDELGRLFAIQMHFVNDIALVLGGEEESDDAMVLQFFVLMPYIAAAGTFGELARAMIYVNRILPVGTFGFSEPDGGIFFQYNLVQNDRSVPDDVLLEVVQMIATFVVKFTPMIESIAQGNRTADDLKQQLLEEDGITLPPLIAPAHPGQA